jgi:putative CocE/NonD family hydrolase
VYVAPTLKRIVTDFPRAVREVPNTWIPLSDGCRLAARIWLPRDAQDDPVPALLEYIPYRKTDGTAESDASRHAYYAGHGYASIRVDIRGAGDSDGILMDEYLLQEQDDALEVIEWIAAQPWCTGNVGMFGISWGGFNSLQVAARRPPALKAIITVASTDDRYADDVHYVGGCLLGADAISWASTMLAFNARPPDPAVVGDRWREMWLERLERTPPFAEAWISHQRRDAFWKHGSVCEDYRAIECAVYAVGGWGDGYTNAIPRLLERLTCPRKGLIGPWAHTYPENGSPEPAIGFLQEALRFWDHWLKGVDTGVMDEPMLRAWMQEPVRPACAHDERPGRWITEPAWPPPSASDVVLALNADGLAADAGAEQALTITGAQVAGRDAGSWCPYGTPVDFPPDQCHEDALSLTFDSRPLEERLEILGSPAVDLELAADRPLALVAVRLCSVAPDGSSLLISRGILNLTHRESHEHPTPLEPGRRYRVTVPLSVAGDAIPPGNRLRVAISPTYWPWAWPSPEPVELSVFAGASSLRLPVRTAPAEEAEPPAFAQPESAPELDAREIIPLVNSREEHWDLERRRLVHTWRHATERRLLVRDNLEHGTESTDVFEITEGDPLSATARAEHVMHLARDGWLIRVETRSVLTSTATSFVVTNEIDAYDGGELVWTSSRAATIPRDLT